MKSSHLSVLAAPSTLAPMRAAALVVVGLISCAGPDTPAVPTLELSRCRPTLTSMNSSAGLVLLSGHRATLSFELTGLLACESNQWEVEGVRVELLDDDNQPIAHDDWLSIQPQHPRPAVLARHLEVSFVPPVTKRVHLRLAVEPSIGVVLHSLPVFQATPHQWESEPRRTCDGLLEPEVGGALCIRAGQVELRSGSGLERVEAVAAATTTSMVWLFEPTRGVTGWRLTPADVATRAFTRRGWTPTSLATRGARLAAGFEDGVSVFDEDGGVTELTVLRPESAVVAVAFIDDETLLVVRHGQALRVPIAPGSLAFQTAQPSRPASSSAEGIWSRGVAPNLLELHQLDGGRAELTLPVGASLTWPRGVPDLVPVVHLGQTSASTEVVGVPALGPDGGLALEFVELPEGTRLQWSTSRRLFATRPDGTLVMTSRAP